MSRRTHFLTAVALAGLVFLARGGSAQPPDLKVETMRIAGVDRDIPRDVRLLNLNDTKITDAGLKDLAPLTNLTKLGLNGTGVTDAGLKNLAPLTKLTRLVVYRMSSFG